MLIYAIAFCLWPLLGQGQAQQPAIPWQGYRTFAVVLAPKGRMPAVDSLKELPGLISKPGFHELQEDSVLFVSPAHDGILYSREIKQLRDLREAEAVIDELSKVKNLDADKLHTLGESKGIEAMVRTQIQLVKPLHADPDPNKPLEPSIMFFFRLHNSISLDDGTNQIQVDMSFAPFEFPDDRAHLQAMYDQMDRHAVPLVVRKEKWPEAAQKDAAEFYATGGRLGINVRSIVRTFDPSEATDTYILAATKLREYEREWRLRLANKFEAVADTLRQIKPSIFPKAELGTRLTSLPKENQDQIVSRIVSDYKRFGFENEGAARGFINGARVVSQSPGIAVNVAFDPDKSLTNIRLWPK